METCDGVIGWDGACDTASNTVPILVSISFDAVGDRYVDAVNENYYIVPGLGTIVTEDTAEADN